MKESIIISGMLEVLAYMIGMAELRVAIPRDYSRILVPDHMIEGWPQARENYYKLERRLIIGQDYPYNRYSNMKMYWPEEQSSHTTRGRIIFFKCINRTPSNAEALMHVIRGGMGTPELLVDVMYTPVRFMLINTMIITCDIYTAETDISSNEDAVLWDPVNITTTNTQAISPPHTTAKIPTGDSFGITDFKEAISSVDMKPTSRTTFSTEGDLERTSAKSGKTVTQGIRVDSPTRRTTGPEKSSKISSRGGMRARTKTTRPYSKATSGIRDETTGRVRVITVKTARKTPLVQGMSKQDGTKTFYTNGPSLKTSSKYLQDDRGNKITLSMEEASLKTEKTTLEATSPETVQTTLQKSIRHPMMDKTKTHMKNKDSGPEETTKIGITSTVNKLVPLMNGISENEHLSLRNDITSLGTTLWVTSPKTVELHTQESSTSLKMNKVSPILEAGGSAAEQATKLPCEKLSPVINETSIKDPEVEKDESSEPAEILEDQTDFPAYNLILKIVPVGSKKKIGLAKITYS